MIECWLAWSSASLVQSITVVVRWWEQWSCDVQRTLFDFGSLMTVSTWNLSYLLCWNSDSWKMRKFSYLLCLNMKTKSKYKCLKYLLFCLISIDLLVLLLNFFDSITKKSETLDTENISDFSWFYLFVHCYVLAPAYKNDECWKTWQYSSLRLMLTHCTQLSYCHLKVYSFLMSRKTWISELIPTPNRKVKQHILMIMSHSAK